MALIVNGFVKDVLQQLPMEFAVEAQKLIAIAGGQRGVRGRADYRATPNLLMLRCEERSAEPRSTRRRSGAAWAGLRPSRLAPLAPQDEASGEWLDEVEAPSASGSSGCAARPRMTI